LIFCATVQSGSAAEASELSSTRNRVIFSGLNCGCCRLSDQSFGCLIHHRESYVCLHKWWPLQVRLILDRYLEGDSRGGLSHEKASSQNYLMGSSAHGSSGVARDRCPSRLRHPGTPGSRPICAVPLTNCILQPCGASPLTIETMREENLLMLVRRPYDPIHGAFSHSARSAWLSSFGSTFYTH